MLESPNQVNETFPSDEKQVQKTKEFMEHVNTHDYLMNRHFDLGEKKQALKEAEIMIQPLRTSDLYPTRYFEIYQAILTSLSKLSNTFSDRDIYNDREIAELYETIQYTSGLVERLYLLFSLAPAFIDRGHAKAVEVLNDLIEIVRGVQEPTRALFLRHFLLHMLKDKFPVGNSEDGTIEDTLNFILENFKQKNVLWVRLEFRLGARIESVKQKQRAELKQLIGFSIQRMSQLPGLEVDHYCLIIMPFLTKQIVECHESMAQSYLLEIMIIAFPFEYHLATLNEIFDTLNKVESDVNILSIISLLISRIQQHFEKDNEGGIQAIQDLSKHIYSLLDSGREFRFIDVIKMLESLCNLVFSIRKDSFDTANGLFKLVLDYINNSFEDNKVDTDESSRGLKRFLLVPLNSIENMSDMFQLQNLTALVKCMKYKEWESFAIEVCKLFATKESYISNKEELQNIFIICSVLLQKQKDIGNNTFPSNGLNTFCKILHLIKGQEINETYDLLIDIVDTIDELSKNDNNVVKNEICLSLGEALLQLSHNTGLDENQNKQAIKNILRTVYKMIDESGIGNDDLEDNSKLTISAFHLFLDAASISDKYLDEKYTEEFMIKVLKLWTSHINLDSSKKLLFLSTIVKYMTTFKNISQETYKRLASEVCSWVGSHLLDTDRINGYLTCAYLFIIENTEDSETIEYNNQNIKSCIRQALKCVGSMINKKDQVVFYYKILSHAVYFYNKGVKFQDDYFVKFMELIDETISELGNSPNLPNTGMINNILTYKKSIVGN